MFIVSVLILIVLSVGVVLIGGGTSIVPAFIDLPSFFVFVLTVIPTLTAAGLLKNFGSAFKIAVLQKDEPSLLSIKNALCAITLTLRVIIATAIFTTVSGLMILLSTIKQLDVLCVNLSVAIMPLCYAMLFLFILLPLRARLEKRLNKKLAATENE